MRLRLRRFLRQAQAVSAVFLIGGLAYADCLTDLKETPVFDLNDLTLKVSVAEISDNPGNISGDPQYASAHLKYHPQTGFFTLSSGIEWLDSSCRFLHAPMSVYDMQSNLLTIPVLYLIVDDKVSFYSAKLQVRQEGAVLIELKDETNGAGGVYTGVLIDSETGKPIAGATVSLNGLDADQPTNVLGQFTVRNINNEICQTLTVNAAGYEAVAMDVDIRYAKPVSCSR